MPDTCETCGQTTTMTPEYSQANKQDMEKTAGKPGTNYGEKMKEYFGVGDPDPKPSKKPNYTE